MSAVAKAWERIILVHHRRAHHDVAAPQQQGLSPGRLCGAGRGRRSRSGNQLRKRVEGLLTELTGAPG
ncbi:hypothetical protein [Spirillospora sp. NPDC048819]|uniref:hypothetical protein n=1 Tax=Spirillospora sp. NPDC048819 TaxID=3155268 RepID=UPI0033E9B4AF